MANIIAIQESLANLPEQIRDAGQEFLEAKNETEKAKLKYEVAMSVATLKSQETNATRQKAEATIATVEEKGELLKSQLEEARKENILNYLENQFVAVRKIASLEEKVTY